MARGKKTKKEFKRANGTGTVYKLSGKRRKPFVALITTGYEFNPETLKSKQIRKCIGTFPTRNEAEAALLEYNINPYDLDNRTITFDEIYTIWFKNKYDKLSDSSINSYTAAYKYCSAIKDTPVYNLKTIHLQSVIDSCDKSFSTKNNIKTIMNGVFTYCMQNDIISKNYAEYLRIEFTDSTFERIPFTNNDINYLWQHSDEDACKILLILLYTGMRVNELLKLPKEHCHIDYKYPYFDVPKELAKNKASIRQVPIHNKILNLVISFYNRNSNYLIVRDNGNRILYNNFATRDLKKINASFESIHRMHDTRHTFISKAHELDLDNLYVKRIVGHTSGDITSRVYTHITLKEMYKEINKIDYIE